MGRASRFEECREKVLKIAELGATNQQIREILGIPETTFEDWLVKHEDFFLDLRVKKAEVDARVVASLFQRACGFEHPAVKIFADPKTGQQMKVDYIEKYPPDTTACIFWLKNRDRLNWRDRIDNEHTGKDGSAIVIKIEKEDAEL